MTAVISVYTQNPRPEVNECNGDVSTIEETRLTRFQGGERGCTGQQFENATPGNCYHLPAGAAFLCSTKVCA
jgi:hypothetical protein